jgi:hypothetical protein
VRARWPTFATYVARVGIGVAVLIPFWYWKGGILELEVLQFIQQYLDGRPFLRKIFDPYANDFGTYQARELSYFFDYLDAQVFKRLMGMDLVVFIPLTAVAASVLTVGIFFWALRRYRTIPALTAALLLLVYLTNYVHVVTMGMFYRSAKPLLAPLLLATSLIIAMLVGAIPGKDSEEPRRRGFWGPLVFVLLCAMSMLDRQGFLYAVVGCAVLAGAAVLRHVNWKLAAWSGAAVALMLSYNWWMGPAIVHAVSGYVPSLDYQQAPMQGLGSSFEPYRRSIELLLEGLGVLIGGVPRFVVGALLIALAAFGAWRFRARPAVLAVLAMIAASQVLMFAIMVQRLPPVYEWIDHRYWYYPLPLQAMVLALAVVFLSRAFAQPARRLAAVVNVLLLAAILGNMLHWDGYLDRQLSSRWFSRVHPQTRALKGSFKVGRPDPNLIKQYREFYDFCLTLSPGLRERVLYPVR